MKNSIRSGFQRPSFEQCSSRIDLVLSQTSKCWFLKTLNPNSNMRPQIPNGDKSKGNPNPTQIPCGCQNPGPRPTQTRTGLIRTIQVPCGGVITVRVKIQVAKITISACYLCKDQGPTKLSNLMKISYMWTPIVGLKNIDE